MDEALAVKVNEWLPDSKKTSEVSVRPLDADTIEITAGKHIETWQLKPLNELFGQGTGLTVDPQNETFMPLFLCIEEEIVNYDRDHGLTDASVELSLDRMGMDPAGPSADPLVRHLQSALRILLSLNDYSRQEVRQAIRKIAKSVARHHNGERGYLHFIAGFLGGGKKR